jgi:hypothetical protein
MMELYLHSPYVFNFTFLLWGFLCNRIYLQTVLEILERGSMAGFGF